jgi:hypothetical protein
MTINTKTAAQMEVELAIWQMNDAAQRYADLIGKPVEIGESRYEPGDEG